MKIALIITCLLSILLGIGLCACGDDDRDKKDLCKYEKDSCQTCNIFKNRRQGSCEVNTDDNDGDNGNGNCSSALDLGDTSNTDAGDAGDASSAAAGDASQTDAGYTSSAAAGDASQTDAGDAPKTDAGYTSSAAAGDASQTDAGDAQKTAAGEVSNLNSIVDTSSTTDYSTSETECTTDFSSTTESTTATYSTTEYSTTDPSTTGSTTDYTSTESSSSTVTESTTAIDTTSTTEYTSTTAKDIDCTDEVSKYLPLIASYAFKFLSEAASQFPRRTIILSPWKLSNNFGVLYLFSTGDSYEDLQTIFQIADKDVFYCVLTRINELVFKLTNGLLNAGTVLAINDNNYTYTDAAQTKIKSLLAIPDMLDFSNSNESAYTINQQLSSATNGQITNVVNASSIQSSDELIIADALYSKLVPTQYSYYMIRKEFVRGVFDVRIMDFFVFTGPVLAYKSAYFRSTIVQFGNSSNAYVNVAIVPDLLVDVRYVLRRIAANSSRLSDEIAKTVPQYAKVFLPKLDEVYNFAELTKIGKRVVPKLFEELQTEDFITQDDTIAITNGFQSISIIIDPVNATVSAPQGVPPKIYDVKYPFIFAVCNNNIPIYVAAYRG